MANTSTLLQTLQVSFPPGGKGGFSQVKQYAVAFDTLAVTTTLHTTTAGKVALVVGYSMSPYLACNVSWYTGATVMLAKVYSADSQAEEPLHSCPGSLIMTKPGEVLAMQMNTALVPTFVLYVAELDSGLYLA
jgi:hypothetical protein